MFTEVDSKPLLIITDDTGMIQHSCFTIPDPNSGYTTDDNARALIAAVMLYERYKSQKYLKLIFRYFSFLIYAQNKTGSFRNFMDYSRNFLEENGSEDCFGRCLWCLGFTINSRCLHSTIKHSSFKIIKNSLPNIGNLNNIRGKAYTLIGLCLIYNFLHKPDIDINISDSIKTTIKSYIIKMSDELICAFKENSDSHWRWFEGELTYGNSIIPLSLLRSCNINKKKDCFTTAIDSLNFLDNLYFKNNYFKPIGCRGWYKKGDSSPAEFDEQPIEACGTSLLYNEAYKITGIKAYKSKAKLCYEWFTGKNSIGLPLIDELTRGCYDGIMDSKINLNTGAESILSKIITQLIISE
ncbi:glycosyltransferase [Clostridium sp. LBM24168]